MYNAGRMRAHFLARSRAGQCECQHFQLPGFPEVDFTFMLYPTGFASMGTAAAPAVLALHVSGCGCEGVGFEVHLTLQLYGPGGAVPLMEAVEEKALAGTGRISCQILWPEEGVDLCLCSCHVLAAPPPRGDPVLRLSRVWEPCDEVGRDDIERLDGDDSD